ncbi:MFS transporter [Allokutzneria sp. A3M-2-11 16]|uniref:MFS transporter n=1 Tax=Allokutzneria sp. A3M-2-11 16 TaxID=2962043 RepID=UPI0020B70943|nr:MFS transporter [Allokutzneria sp. A3M-2-11 16]MCP3802865.1 MFS transporter [Allokutzneria sp. A3M-2-11 16]
MSTEHENATVADPDPVARKREQRGWIWYDWANSVFPTSVSTVFLSIYLTTVAQSAAQADTALNGPNPCPNDDTLRNCDIVAFGLQLPAGSLWGYLLSVATVVQVLVLPISGAIADRAQNKRRMLAGFAFAGSAATMALGLVSGSNWELGAILFVLGNICYGASIVVYYAFLPEIADPDERDAVSSRGWAFGYLGGGLALALQLVLFLMHEQVGLEQGTAVQLCFVITGLWWAGFTLVPLSRLKRHRAPAKRDPGSSVLVDGFRELRSTVRAARAFPLTLAFLGAYLIYTDGISTVANVAGQYGKLELKLDQDVLIATILLTQFIAFIGGVVHGMAARFIGAKRTIMISLALWIVVLAAAFFVEAGDMFQFFGVAIGIGFVLGGTNALSRSLFSQMVPPGREAQYFSLYEIGERSTSWLGPMLYAGIGQATGSFRYAILSLMVFFVVGIILISLVPIRKAIERSGNTVPTLV